jgi:hypothetical protein
MNKKHPAIISPQIVLVQEKKMPLKYSSMLQVYMLSDGTKQVEHHKGRQAGVQPPRAEARKPSNS